MVFLLLVAMATSPSLFVSSQNVASLHSKIMKYEEVSVAVVWRVCGHVLPGGIWYLCVGDKET